MAPEGTGSKEPVPLAGLVDEGQESPWLESGSEPFAPVSEDIRCDVAVVGGGIVGVSTAYRLARAGCSVVLVEARRLAAGVTGHSSAKLSALQGLAYSAIADRNGGEAASAYAELNARGIRFVEETTAALGIDCGLTHRPAVSYAETDEGRENLALEMDAALAAGLAVTDEDLAPLPFPVAATLTLENQAHFDPVKWVRGLAGALTELGGRVHETSRVTGVDGLRGNRKVKMENGVTIEAERVVLATHVPILDRAAFYARVKPLTSFAVAGQIEGPLPQGLYLSDDGPTRSISPLPGGGGTRSLLVGGESHRPGTEDSAVSVARLRQFMRSRFEVRSVDCAWGAHDMMSFDRLPIVGRLLPFDSRILTATGFSKWGLAAGAGSSELLADQLLGEDNPVAATFDPVRLRLSSVPTLVRHNLESGAMLLADRINRRRPRRRLQPGEGMVVGDGVGQKAVSCDRDGVYRELSARCTHLGCIVAWNQAGQSWDCPCHGSRFSPDGSVIEGPAVAPLERSQVITPPAGDS